MILYKVLTLLVISLPSLVNGQPGPLACLEVGTCYQGSWATTDQGTGYAGFQGVQYAHHPVGELRFRPPVLFSVGEILYDVSGVSEVMCPQVIDGAGLVGQEECLLLNIYVPEAALTGEKDPLPVMVWLHGGALLFGSNRFADQGPQHLLDQGVVVVTVNYRLGPLGFLSLGSDLVPGNAGLRDQSLALSWVRQNIINFGGNPDSVTLFGESSGSIGVALQVLSPQTQGLFQRVIMQSGDALDQGWGPITPAHALEYGALFTRSLGCQEEEDVLPCLQAKDVTDILALTTLGDLYSAWLPVPDSDFSSDPFLPGDPEELMRTGQFNTDIEVVVGTNKDEGIYPFFDLLADPTLWEDYRNNFDVYGVQYMFNIANKSDITEEDVEKAHALVEFYVGSMENINEEHKHGMFDLFTDAVFLYGTYKTINYFLEHGVTVFQYILTYRGQFSFSQDFGVDPLGVCHADDLIYIWNPVDIGDADGNLTGEDALVRTTITTAWGSFARYGDPTPPGSQSSWAPLTSADQFWNISGPVPAMDSSNYIQERMKLWTQVIG